MNDDDEYLGADELSDSDRLKQIERIREDSMESYLRTPGMQKEYSDLVAGQMDDEVDAETREAAAHRYENSRRLKEIEDIRSQSMDAYFRSPSLQAEYEELIQAQSLLKRS